MVGSGDCPCGEDERGPSIFLPYKFRVFPMQTVPGFKKRKVFSCHPPNPLTEQRIVFHVLPAFCNRDAKDAPGPPDRDIKVTGKIPQAAGPQRLLKGLLITCPDGGQNRAGWFQCSDKGPPVILAKEEDMKNTTVVSHNEKRALLV